MDQCRGPSRPATGAVCGLAMRASQDFSPEQLSKIASMIQKLAPRYFEPHCQIVDR